MKSTLSSIIGGALLGAASLSSAADIDVMTQNQYIGVDLAPVFAAATADPFDPAAFNAAVVTSLGRIAAGRPTDRARALAAEIAKRNPDVVGLQEAFKLECTQLPNTPPGRGCDDPAVSAAFRDRLQDTEAALLGEYVVAGKVTNLQVSGIPFLINGFPAVLALADRDAILVRKGLSAAWVNFAPFGACTKPSDQGCNYVTAPPPVPTPLGINIAIERGFLAVDVTVRNRAYRVFNTHLEQRQLAPDLPQTRLLQVGQALELAGTAVATWDGVKTLIVVGDINSDPRDTIPSPPFPPNTPTPYQVFTVLNNFTDAWTLRSASGDGLTCCQDEDLANRGTEFQERIDMIFSRPRPSKVVNMKVLGVKMGEKTRPPGNGGLWPSDHAALAAKLKYD